MGSEATKQVNLRHADSPRRSVEDGRLSLQIPVDGVRGGVSWSADLERPGVIRDALLTMTDILTSDLRFKARDRSDYLAYLLQQGKQASPELWKAQKAFLESQYGEQENPPVPLEPMLTVDPDGLAWEVFSADESAYARLFLKNDGAFTGVDAKHGTTYLPVTPALVDALEGIRSYRPTSLSLSPFEDASDRAIEVPYRWIRAFGQVQAASTLPASTFEIAPVDLYNVLLTLRSRRAKTAPRALRYELIPGELPRLVLEPWDLVVPASGAVYDGDRPMVVRTWGRKRLMVLSRLLPHATRLTVQLVGAGLPAYYVVELPGISLTLALSGWTDSGWAGISTFDLLVTDAPDELLSKQVCKHLEEGPKSFDELLTCTKRDKADVRAALLSTMQEGTVVHDVAEGQFRARAMFETPPDVAHLRYRDDKEEAAHRLLEIEDQVKLTKVHDLGGDGVKIEGEVEDRTAHRTYRASFTLDREGRTVDAACTSPQFRRSGLREGPTVPMIALRLLYARQQAAMEAARHTEEGRKLIRAETRTFVKRIKTGALTYRMSLDDRQVVMRWGTLAKMRMQRLVFSTADEAKTEYFGRLERLTEKGFIDATSAELA